MKALLACAVVVLALVVGIAASACADSGLSDRITATVEKGPGTILDFYSKAGTPWAKEDVVDRVENVVPLHVPSGQADRQR